MMIPRPRRERTTETSLLFLSSFALLAAPLVHANVENDASIYPSAAQPCLEETHEQSNCEGNTVDEMNDCLCSNRSHFVTHAARCLGAQAPNTLHAVYNTMNATCYESGTLLILDEEEFLQIGAEASSVAAAGPPSTSAYISSSSSPPASSHASSTSATPTAFSWGTLSTAIASQASSTLSPVAHDTLAKREEADDKSPPLSTGVIAGISVGSASVAAFLLFTFIILWKRVRRNRTAHDEARPMLDNAGAAGGSNGRAATWNSSPGIGSDGGKSVEGVYPSATAPPPGWKAPDGRPGWRPANQNPAPGVVLPGGWSPPQEKGFDAQHSKQQQLENGGAWGYRPSQPWQRTMEGGPQLRQLTNRALGPVAELPSLDKHPEAGGTDPNKEVYELASMPAGAPAAVLPKEPVEMPGSLGRVTQVQAQAQSKSQSGPQSGSPRKI